MTNLHSWKNVYAAFLFSVLATIASPAQTLTTLVEFTGTQGQAPSALIQGFDGDFYGTTQRGGANNSGSAFRLTSSGTMTTLYSFCSQFGQGFCSDGKEPTEGLVQATNGTFYGTTTTGGMDGMGSIFTVDRTGKFTSLYSFCAQMYCLDGFEPDGLVQAINGNLYGTTLFGGQLFYGTVFEITPTGTLTTLHSFDNADGNNPYATLLQATNGNLYGTTITGSGPSIGGTVFQVTPSGTLTTVHYFNEAKGDMGGDYPNGLIQGPDGSLYGTTKDGGTGTQGKQCYGGNCGVVFRITPAGKFTTIYDFCSQTNCSEGGYPQAGLVLGTDGNFYGTTYFGGNNNNAGTIFKITPQGVLTTLYTFCSQPNCTDGANPGTALMQSTDGNFYGTTFSGGQGGLSGDMGTIFRLSTGLGPFVKLVRNAGKVGQTGGILGQGFTGTTGVFLNGTPANFTVVSDTYIQAAVPAGGTSGFVTVDTPGGVLTSNVPFHVIP